MAGGTGEREKKEGGKMREEEGESGGRREGKEVIGRRMEE